MSDSRYGKTALIAEVAKATGLTQTQVAQVVNATLATIQHHVQSGQQVTLTNFGSFKLSQRSARNGINPQTRAPMQIPARQAAHWTPASTFLHQERSQPLMERSAPLGRTRAADTTTPAGIPRRRRCVTSARWID
jgi:nucleoid DNA-binding protein